MDYALKKSIGRNCLLSQNGVEYMGTINEGNSGEPCEYWNNTGLPANKLSFISDVNEALYGVRSSYSNQCTNFNGDLNGPWCYKKTNQTMTCSIKYCGLFYDMIVFIFKLVSFITLLQSVYIKACFLPVLVRNI